MQLALDEGPVKKIQARRGAVQRSNQLNYVFGFRAVQELVGSAGLEPATSCL